MKTQDVRALDVWVIGPAMIAGGSVVYKHAFDNGERRALGAFLIAAGIGTIIYNGSNWLKGEAAAEAAAAPPTTSAATPEPTTPAAPLAPRV